MLGRPRDLAGRMAEPPRETITLPLSAARLKAREILDLQPQGGYSQIVRVRLAAFAGTAAAWQVSWGQN
jgi:hypothetical protein